MKKNNKRYPLSIFTIFLLILSLNKRVTGQNSIGLKIHTTIPKPIHPIKTLNLSTSNIYKTHISTNTEPLLLPIVFSIDKLPFFCKIEHKMSKGVQIPIKFRLGTVEYVDRMEGKIKEY